MQELGVPGMGLEIFFGCFLLTELEEIFLQGGRATLGIFFNVSHCRLLAGSRGIRISWRLGLGDRQGYHVWTTAEHVHGL